MNTPSDPSALRTSVFAHGSLEYGQSVALRQEVLRTPLGLTLDPTALAGELDSLHIGCWQAGEMVGCLILKPLSPLQVCMRQVAVAPAFQGRGIGTRLVQFAETLARDRGFHEIVMHARQTAVAFYEKLGYRCEGEPFVEVTLPHRAMRKAIS